jgi:tRNA threonylcarbamoyl adenosine modification protein YjeE
MSARWVRPAEAIPGVERIAELVALKVRPGDVVALSGDLGAGKTTFARALIRAILADPAAEVPSPTFPLVIAYAASRLAVAHFDFYRLQGASDLDEIGFHDAAADGLAIVEWPERIEDDAPEAARGSVLGPDRLDISFTAASEPDARCVSLQAHGTWLPRLERLRAIHAFLDANGAGPTSGHIAYLQGDASTRAYARVVGGTAPLVLMDAPRMADGPPIRNGLSYSRIAHLAEDVRPFVAVGTELAAKGLSVPAIVAVDLDRGLLLLEDLGHTSFARALADGVPQADLLRGAVDVLLALRRDPPPRALPLADGSTWHLPRFDRAALEIEIGLLLDWYWPAVKGAEAPAVIRAEFEALWSPVLDRMLAEPAGFFLRDFHSPNLFWLPERTGVRRVGVIDFQDALAEPWAYDLVSLLQDARVDVPAALEASQMARYKDLCQAQDDAFDGAALDAAYAAFGAQRNTRLVGLWVRLLRRDGKPGYLQHMPRTWDYLARNLAHPGLAPLRAWYDRHLPLAVRNMVIAT